MFSANHSHEPKLMMERAHTEIAAEAMLQKAMYAGGSFFEPTYLDFFVAVYEFYNGEN